MTTESLQGDLKANIESLRQLSALSTPADIVDHLKNTLWPFLESMAQEHGELDEVVGDMYNNAEDILQYETAQLFGAVIAGALVLVDELATRVGNDRRILKSIAEWRTKAKEAHQVLEEITVPDDPDAESDDGDDEDEGPETDAEETESDDGDEGESDDDDKDKTP